MGARAVTAALQRPHVSLFGKIAKAVVGTVARTVVGSVPILGGVVSAVGAVKSSIHPPTLASTAGVSSRTGVPQFGAPGLMATPRGIRRAGRKSKPTARTRTRYGSRITRRSSAKPGGVSAKQRAARARFARAARKGRIRKGSHL